MKRTMALLLVSALLICSLTACGCSATPPNAPDHSAGQETPADGDHSAVIEGDTGNAAIPDNQQEDPALGGDSPLEEGIDDIRDGVDNAVDDITGSNDSAGVSYGQMLRNGRVKNSELADDGIASNR